MYLYIILGIIVLFIIYILLNAYFAKNKRNTSNLPRKNVSQDKLNIYVNKLQKMLRCKTVFKEDGSNDLEFEKFRNVLKEEFPLIHKHSTFYSFDGCLVFKLDGVNATKNVMLMSHHDVVEDEGEWVYPAFEASIHDGAIYARGSIDTKTPLFAELMAIEELLEEGYIFDGFNVYIASSNNEEIAGPGIPMAVKFFKENNIHFDVVVDEGGAIVEKMMPGVKEKSAMIAVHEKGRHGFKCKAKALVKGHTGLNPTKDNTVERMANFISEVKKSKMFKKSFAPEVEQTFRVHAPYMPFPLRIIFANFNLFKGLLLKILVKVSSAIEAMLSTTMSFTKIMGGNYPQIASKEVEATAFFRCVRVETLNEELKEFRKIANKYHIEIEEEVVDYCKPSSHTMPQYKMFESVLHENFPDIIISPFLLTAGTDARHMSEVADCILRFAPIDLDTKQYASIHNPNEHIYVKNIGECVCFYKDFIKKYH